MSPADLRESSSQVSRLRSRALRSALSWFGLFVSALFAYFAVRHVRFSDVWDGLRTSDFWWLVPALAMLAVAIYVKAVRWRYMFARQTRPGLQATVSSLLIGYFFNSILPARAGEAARVLALKKRAGTSRAEAAGTVVVERAYDVLVLLVLLFVSVPWLPRVTWLHAAVVFAVVLGGGLALAIGVFAVFGLRPIHFVLRPLGRLPFLSRERVERIGGGLGQGLAALRQPRLALGALFWTTLGWLALAASTWFVMHGFHLHLSPVAGLLVVIATNLAQILPSSPSAVGVFEAATLVALRAYDVPDSRALSFALVMHVLNFLPFIAAGLFLLRGTLRLGDAKTAA
ncbi:MAG: flippase-like domain-containing protein [Actinomycetota bacterium]|nr:flippase-like domain-containing protein [Actinomycetota bacterium]